VLDGHLSGDALQIGAAARGRGVPAVAPAPAGRGRVGARGRAVLATGAAPARTNRPLRLQRRAPLLALLCAGEVGRAEHQLARCAERAMAGDDARRDNHLMAREVGLPLARGLLAFAKGDCDGAADQLYAARSQAWRLGGSHAQRDVFDLTALVACVHGGRKSLGRALLNERTLARPMSPLTRHWSDALGASCSHGAVR
jgi:hypothetical protein